MVMLRYFILFYFFSVILGYFFSPIWICITYHTQVKSWLPRLDATYNEIPNGGLLMRDNYWCVSQLPPPSPTPLSRPIRTKPSDCYNRCPFQYINDGADVIIRGASTNLQNYVSPTLVDDVYVHRYMRER